MLKHGKIDVSEDMDTDKTSGRLAWVCYLLLLILLG